MQCFCYAPKVDHLGGNTICIVMHLQQLADKGGCISCTGVAFLQDVWPIWPSLPPAGRSG
jgi:hypothetical protein